MNSKKDVKEIKVELKGHYKRLNVLETEVDIIEKKISVA
jgi:hypothetical protein